MRRRATYGGVCSESETALPSTVSITKDGGLVAVLGFLRRIEEDLGQLVFADAEK